MQLAVRERALVSGLTFPYQGKLVAPRFQMAIQAVVGCVQLPADEPLGVRRVPLEDLIPLAEPVELLCPLRPEGFPVRRRLLVGLAIGDQSGLRELGRWFERSVFGQ